MVPITDPATLAALDRQRRQARDYGAAARITGGAKVRRTPTASQVLRLCHQLTAKERLQVMTQLAGELSADQQAVLLRRCGMVS